jgi:hypothetical protein
MLPKPVIDDTNDNKTLAFAEKPPRRSFLTVEGDAVAGQQPHGAANDPVPQAVRGRDRCAVARADRRS